MKRKADEEEDERPAERPAEHPAEHPAERSAKRSDKSLKVVTQQIVDLLRDSGRTVVLQELSNITCRRRCYDVILVLEALGLVERVARKSVRWKTPEFDESAISSYFEDI